MGERAIYSAIVVIGAVLWWVSTRHYLLYGDYVGDHLTQRST
jgi:hypothetical protein